MKKANKSNGNGATSSTLTKLAKAIRQAAKDLNKKPSSITKGDVISTGLFSEYELRKLPSLDSVKKKFWPVQDKDLVSIRNVKKHNSYVSKLEAQVAELRNAEERFRALIDKIVTPIPRKRAAVKFNKKGLHREVVAMLNDTHIGVIVDPEEINHGNAFDFKQAGRRFAYFVKEIADFKVEKRNEVKKLHIIFNGDLIAGIIHGLDGKGIHLLGHQINGALHIFVHCLEFLLEHFSEIEVHGIAGNHCRRTHKNGGQRAVNEVYDSYANDIFYALSVAFRKNPQISFNFPKTPYGFIDLPAGRAMFCHGDHIFSKSLGNPGKVISVKALSEAIKDFNAGEIAKGNPPIKLILFGHVHTYAHFITNDGVEVYVAPSLVGLDSFAHSLTINNNFIAQVVFESTPNFILGDNRLIRLNGADQDPTLDLIVPEYKKELKYSKGR